MIIDGILWILKTGAPWRDLPERYEPWQMVYGHFNQWRQEGLWQSTDIQEFTKGSNHAEGASSDTARTRLNRHL